MAQESSVYISSPWLIKVTNCRGLTSCACIVHLALITEQYSLGLGLGLSANALQRETIVQAGTEVCVSGKANNHA